MRSSWSPDGRERLPARAPQACCRVQGRARSVTLGRSSAHCIRPSWPLCPVTLLGAATFTLHFRVRTNDKLGGSPIVDGDLRVENAVCAPPLRVLPPTGQLPFFIPLTRGAGTTHFRGPHTFLCPGNTSVTKLPSVSHRSGHRSLRSYPRPQLSLCGRVTLWYPQHGSRLSINSLQ